MPLYDYRCATCGDFRAIRPMAESSAAGVCPTCGAASERVLVTPFLAGKDSGGGTAQRAGPSAFPRACGHSHGCSH
jgi:putative FmdB family regulatory protein